ncbi:MAG TPA: hypothetical protein VHU18_03875 [Rhizomicrobium sp.]|nr:hypothetical protein [Rhizomicrobium sp.]
MLFVLPALPLALRFALGRKAGFLFGPALRFGFTLGGETGLFFGLTLRLQLSGFGALSGYARGYSRFAIGNHLLAGLLALGCGLLVSLEARPDAFQLFRSGIRPSAQAVAKPDIVTVLHRSSLKATRAKTSRDHNHGW